MEGIPGILKERLDIALEGREDFLVLLDTLRANKRAEEHIAVRAAILLAVHAERIELVLLDTAAQVCIHCRPLLVTLEVWLWEGRMAD